MTYLCVGTLNSPSRITCNTILNYLNLSYLSLMFDVENWSFNCSLFIIKLFKTTVAFVDSLKTMLALVDCVILM